MSEEAPRQTTWVLVLATAFVLFGAFILSLAMVEEPYHIDELRQVSAYSKDFAGVVDASFGQEQPPLDALANSWVQGVIGVGDAQQRALSVVFGVGSLVLLALLTARSKLRFGAAMSVAYVALSPAVVSVTAYARPYAIAIFLIVAYLFSVDSWIRSQGKVAGLLMFVLALLLPLARTVEPLLALGSTMIAMAVLWITDRSRRVVALPFLSGLAGIVFVGLPVLGRLSQNLGEYTNESLLPSASEAGRIVTVLPGVVAANYPFAILAVVALLAILIRPSSRQRLIDLWWWWVLAAIPLLFALAFFARTPVDQPYFDRYSFSFALPIAVLLGLLVDEALTRGWANRMFVGAIVTPLLLGSAVLLHRDLTTVVTGDWSAVAEQIDDQLEPGTSVIFDSVRPLGAYRTPYRGWRYGGSGREIGLTLQLIRAPQMFGDEHAVAVLLLGQRPDVSSWAKVPIDDYFTLYVPVHPHIGYSGMAEAAEEFAAAVGEDEGAALALTAAAFWELAGDGAAADGIVDRLMANPDLGERIRDALNGSDLEVYLDN